MASRRKNRDAWDEQAGDAESYGGYNGYNDYDSAGAGYDEGGQYGGYDYDDGERGLILQSEQSLVGVSSTITQHGAPLLSYTRTMSRFYNNRRQRLSLGRHKCEVCGERIRFWAYETPSGARTHDGCYERLAWTWTSLYADQQRQAAEGTLE